jgi:hypothetical protein
MGFHADAIRCYKADRKEDTLFRLQLLTTDKVTEEMITDRNIDN